MTSPLALSIALQCVSFVQGDPIPHRLTMPAPTVLVDTQSGRTTRYRIYANDKDGVTAGTRLAPDQVSSLVIGPREAGRRAFLQIVITNGTVVQAGGWCR